MSSLLTLYFHQFLTFVLVLTRVGALFMALPIFGGTGTPMQARALLAVTIALLITPLHFGQVTVEPENLPALVGVMAKEALLGLALGGAVMALVGGVQLAGQVIGQTSGLSLADVADPTFESNISVFSHFLELVTLAVFFCIGGHRMLIDALLDSFRWMPPGQGRLPPDLVQTIAEVTGQSFVTGLRAAAPIMVALILATLIVAVISRTLPQLNAIAVGMNLNSMVALAVLALCLGAATQVFDEQVRDAMAQIRSTFATETGDGIRVVGEQGDSNRR
jgi:flagellar biosynthetic protein FliR